MTKAFAYTITILMLLLTACTLAPTTEAPEEPILKKSP